MAKRNKHPIVLVQKKSPRLYFQRDGPASELSLVYFRFDFNWAPHLRPTLSYDIRTLTVDVVFMEEMEVCLAAPRGGAAAPRRERLLKLEMALIPDMPLTLWVSPIRDELKGKGHVRSLFSFWLLYSYRWTERTTKKNGIHFTVLNLLPYIVLGGYPHIFMRTEIKMIQQTNGLMVLVHF